MRAAPCRGLGRYQCSSHTPNTQCNRILCTIFLPVLINFTKFNVISVLQHNIHIAARWQSNIQQLLLLLLLQFSSERALLVNVPFSVAAAATATASAAIHNSIARIIESQTARQSFSCSVKLTFLWLFGKCTSTFFPPFACNANVIVYSFGFFPPIFFYPLSLLTVFVQFLQHKWKPLLRLSDLICNFI